MGPKGYRKYADKYPFIIESYERGLTIIEIGKITGIHHNTVLRMLHEKGVDVRKVGQSVGHKRKKK